MEVRPSALRIADGWTTWLSGALLFALGALAYRPLLLGAFQLPTHSQLEGMLFRPAPLPALLVVSVAGWCLWRRRTRLFALPVRRAPITAALCLALGASIFAWAHLTRASDLFLPSLSAQLLAFAAALRGRAGCRVVALPALALLLGVQIPGPLHDEIIWRLQHASASGAAWLLECLGREVLRGGVILRNGGHSFHVIDGCSGIRGMLILTVVALIVRELFSNGGWRPWLLLPLAPLLGFALNVVRIAYVADSAEPEALAGMGGDHTPQGIAVLLVGTLILYATGLGLAGPANARTSPIGSAGPSDTALRSVRWISAGWLALLAAFSASVPPFAPADQASRPRVQIPEQIAGWVSEPLVGDPLFFGAGQHLIHRRYQPVEAGRASAADAVELFVGSEPTGQPGNGQLFSSKFNSPGPDWDVQRSSRATLWLLQRDADLTIASRAPGGEHAVVYTWRPGDLGLWRESWRSLLALDSSPFRRERARIVVRLIAFAPHDGSQVLAHAKRRLDQFIALFLEHLAAL